MYQLAKLFIILEGFTSRHQIFSAGHASACNVCRPLHSGRQDPATRRLCACCKAILGLYHRDCCTEILNFYKASSHKSCCLSASILCVTKRCNTRRSNAGAAMQAARCTRK